MPYRDIKGRFIVFEGLDGAGKSTQVDMLVKRMQESLAISGSGQKVIKTMEPAGTELGAALRELMHSDNSLTMETRLWLIMAAREQHVQKVILPALRNGDIVVCDRFDPSTMAYQVAGGIDPKIVSAMNNLATKDMKSYMGERIVIYLDIPAEIAFDRSKKRPEEPSVYEKKKGFMEKVLLRYRSMDNMIKFDAQLPPEVLHERIWTYVKTYINVNEAEDRGRIMER